MVFSLFSKDRALKKTIERATSKMGQSVDRWAAMEKLRDIGTDECLYALCKRFSFTYDKTIEDQQEKDWTVDVLVSKGEAVLPPLQRYMKNALNLGYPLSVVRRICSGDKLWEVTDTILADEEPGYVRNPRKRIDVIEWMGELDEPTEEIVKRIIPYIGDFDENVKFKSVDVVSRHPHPSLVKPLAEALTDDEEESQRLRVRMAEVLAELKLPLGDYKDKIAALTQNELTSFTVNGDLLVQK
jgi:hypothetical protein